MSTSIVGDPGRVIKSDERSWIDWALAQRPTHAGAKLVLLILAHHVNRRLARQSDRWLAWPSVLTIAELACMGRTAVLDNLQRLQTMGLIQDTGRREGTTRQVIVWQLGNSPESVLLKGSDSEPLEASKGPDFGGKGSGFRTETVRNPDTTPRGTLEKGSSGGGRAAGAAGGLAPPAAAAPAEVELPEGLDRGLFNDLVANGKPTAGRVRELARQAYALKAQGHDVDAMARQAIAQGWARWPLPPLPLKPKPPRMGRASKVKRVTNAVKSWEMPST